MPDADAHLPILLAIRDGWLGALRDYGGVIDVGPFRCTFDAGSDLVWTNYATPLADATLDAMRDALPRLREAFAQRQRTLRFEFIDALQPGMAQWLDGEGLALQIRMPLMARLAVMRDVVPPPGATIEPLDADASHARLRDFIETRDSAFGPMSSAAIDEQILDLRNDLGRGAFAAAMVRLDGQPASAGALMGSGPVRELVGIATRPSLRHRGLASYVTRWLANRHMENTGAQAVWLSAGNDEAQRIYDRLGFRPLGTQSAYLAAEVADKTRE